MTADWKYVLSIEKSEFADDKPWIIEGVVTGPNYVDAAGDEFLPEAIQKMADYINENPLPILDWHGLNHKNTIMDAEMGETIRAWVNEAGQLAIEAELDKDNPTAKWLNKKINDPVRPRKFGLSVKGTSVNPRVVMQSGGIKRQSADVIPEEISLTTRPFYQPSFGTVIMKAIDEAAESESVDKGDKSVMANDAPLTPEENKESLLPAVDAEPEKEGVTPVTEIPEPDKNVSVAVAEPVSEDAKVEKSESELPAPFVTALETTIRNIVRQEIGNSKVEPVAPSVAETPAEASVEKSESETTDVFVTLSKALEEINTRLERIEENTPEVKTPGVLVQKSEIDEARAALAQMSPEERMREGFRLMGSNLR